MFSLKRAQKFRRLSSTDEDMEMLGYQRPEYQGAPPCYGEEPPPMKPHPPYFQYSPQLQQGPPIRKSSLSKFAASASKALEHDRCNGGEGVNSPAPSHTPMKDVATDVKNMKGVVTFMQKASVKSGLKERLRKIAEERLTIKQIFKRYVDQSTLHGFRYTCTNTYYVRRFLWACLMILGAVYFVIKLHEGILHYYSYPFSTLSTLEYVEGSMPFPAISFCTVNQFKVNQLANSSLRRLYLQDRLPLSRNWSEPDYDIPGDELKREMERVSLSIKDIFKECDWIRRDTSHPMVPHRNCSTANFTSFFSDSGELCFTLNSGQDNHPKLEVDHFGVLYGYEALFDFNNDDVIPFNDYTGIRVIVHDPKDLPVGKVGFLVSPGFKMFINMQRTEVR